MQKIIEDNYKSTVNRGLITNRTTTRDFILKLNEEVQEFKDFYRQTTKIDPLEVADIILVCLNLCKHNDIDIEKHLTEKIKINQNR